jgi:hypothetical protein
MYRESLPSRSISEYGYDRPNDQEVIWRFLDLSELITIISTKKLVVSRIFRTFVQG